MKALSDELMVHIIGFLRAIDIARLAEVDKTIFSRKRLSFAIRRIMIESPVLPLQIKKLTSLVELDILTAATLYVFEVNSILSSLSFPQPIESKGKRGFLLSFSVFEVILLFNMFRVLDQFILVL
jgi:hypothetical protein